MPSPEALAIQQQMAAMPKDLVLSLEEQRAFCELFGERTAEPVGVTHRADVLGGVPCEWAVVGDSSTAVVYVHGGGFVMGSVAMYRRLVGHIALAAGCDAVSVDYRLAPENPFPAGVSDVAAVVEDAIERFGRIAVVGDSAGGALAIAAVLDLLQRGRPAPAAVATMSAWADLTCSGESYVTRAAVDPLATPDAGATPAGLYLAEGTAPDHPLASPVFADYTGFPPLLLQVGDHEVLLDDSVRIAKSAGAVGVDVQLQVWPEMHHVFQLAAGNVPEADEAVRELGNWVRSRLDQR